MKHLFHLPAILEGQTHLPDEEAHHAVSVLRLREADRIGLLDGQGHSAEGTIVLASKKGVLVQVEGITTHPMERTARIHIAVAPTKQMERFEWMLEKCTEIGVDRITPLITDRTERTRLRMDRLHKVLVSAMKQSQRTWLPRLDEATTINDLISGGIPTQRSFGWCKGQHTAFNQVHDPRRDSLMLIGPEGDFTEEEALHLRTNGCAAVSLGSARLRTETAAITACAWMNLAQQV
jgi:16S rRNA (uracil1498-N3)-methyltransferase